MEDRRAKEIWSAVLGELEVQVTRPIFETWLKDTTAISLTQDTLTVAVPTPFAAEWLEKRMYGLIQKAAQRVAQSPLEVQITVGGTAPPPPAQVPTLMPFNDNQIGLQNLNRRYTFETFIVGSCNHLAYSAARAVAEAPGLSYNPLFIYSGVGLGKTHLLHAVAFEVYRKGLSFIYVTSEQFTNDFIRAIRDRTTEEFRSKYRSPDVLLIDDIQFISGKEQTQEGFFHTFNDLHNANRQIIITSDRHPKAMSLLEDRLTSRFEGGLIVDMQPPDFETRIAILKAKAEQLQMQLEDDVVEFLARKVQKNVRELEGSLNRLVAYSRLTKQPITLELATQLHIDSAAGGARPSVTPEQVIEAVARHFKVSREALLGRRRDKSTALARQVVMYLLREELSLGFSEIGRILGGKDHATVIHAVGRINYELNTNSPVRQEVLSIKEALFTPQAR